MKATIRATRREELEELSALVPGLRGKSGALVTECLGPYFESEDAVLESTRTLVTADNEVWRLHAALLDAARRSEVGTAENRIKWTQEFGRFESEEREARVALKRARAEREKAVAAYHELQSELFDAPVPL